MKHLNPRQGITKSVVTPARPPHHLKCETPKSPPGDYKLYAIRDLWGYPITVRCETPKSPPGDYKPIQAGLFKPARVRRIECETPKSPPGDYKPDFDIDNGDTAEGVKHLNPRQGITNDGRTDRYEANADV